jgi:hypothetical protein
VALDSLASHHRIVIKAMREGRVVPLVGAAVYFEYPLGSVQDLVRVSQYAP